MNKQNGTESTESNSAGSEGYGDEQATLGDRITAGREALGLTQAQLAERLGVTNASLEEWEYDQSAPRANRLQILAGVLNVSLVWLMSGEGDGIADNTDETETNDIESVLRNLRQLRTEHVRMAERTGLLEKKLRSLLDA